MTDYVLDMQDERTVLAGEAATVVLVSIGRRTLAREYLKHDPPSPIELENAIAAIEDEIARAPALPAKGSGLRTADPRVSEIARAAGLPTDGETTLSLGAVEQAFQRLAAQAGRGPRSEGVPPGDEQAAALLILRELMHHLGFTTILVQPR